MPENAKDVFVIHSKGDPVEGALASRLIELLSTIGISSYQYSDWSWTREDSKVRYSSSGSYIDPVRYAMGHPEPFRRNARVDVTDKDTLEDLLDECRMVVLIAPRGGSPSEGVYAELGLLRGGMTILGASWGEHNNRVFQDYHPGYVYHIRNIYDEKQEQSAVDLAHLVWLLWAMDHLVREGRECGRALVGGVGRQDPNILRILNFSERLKVVAEVQSDAGAFGSGEAGLIVRFWRGDAALQHQMPRAAPEVAKLTNAFWVAVDSFCDTVLQRDQTVADEIWSEELACRAERNATSAPGEALADIEDVLTMGGASGAGKSHALWVRANIHMRKRDTPAAIADLTAAIDVPKIAPLRKALCLRDRARCRQHAGDGPGAMDDFDAATRIQGLPGEVAGPIYLDHAVLCGEAGNVHSALRLYERAIELADVPDETRLKAHLYRGLALRQSGDRIGAVRDFAAVQDDPASPEEIKRAAMQQLAELDPLR